MCNFFQRKAAALANINFDAPCEIYFTSDLAFPARVQFLVDLKLPIIYNFVS